MLPSPLFAFIEGGAQVKIVGAGRQTRKPIIVYDKEVYRDKPTPVSGGGSGAIASLAASGASASASVPSGIGATVTTTDGGGSTEWVASEVSTTSSIAEEDDYTHLAKRYIPKIDTLVEFWDDEDEVGEAMQMTVTTTTNSAIIVVPNAELLTPGQTIAGPDTTIIPAGTKIVKILTILSDGTLPVLTAAVMSKKAIGAGGDVAATLGGSNKVGEFMQSEFVSWGNEISIPT